MTLDERDDLVSLLYQLQSALKDEAEERGADIDDTLDEAIKTLLCRLEG